MVPGLFHTKLIAAVLGDTDVSPTLQRLLLRDEVGLEFRAYQEVLRLLNQLYGDVPSPVERRACYYTAMQAPFGPLWIAATDKGIVRISFARSEASFLAEIPSRTRTDLLRSDDRLNAVIGSLKEYFSGACSTLDLPVDLSTVTPFQRRVLQKTAEVPLGQVITYGELARRIGQPGASRAVGQALGRNPVPVVIPCHRIIGTGQTLGGYTGGLHIKKTLLQLEGVPAIPDSGLRNAH